MGTTYLELTNRVLRRLNEVEMTSGDFSSAKGIQAAAKDAVLDIVRDMNTQKFEWPFNAATGTQVLTAGQEEYSWPAALRIPDWESFYIELDDALSVNTIPLAFINREQYQRYLKARDLNSEATGLAVPRYVFETASGGFGVTPSPNAAYTVKFTYFIKTIDLDTYDDVCTIPTEYDHVVTEGALNHLYMFLDNDERARKAEVTYRNGLNTMSYVLIPKDKNVWDHRVSPSRAGDRKMFTGY